MNKVWTYSRKIIFIHQLSGRQKRRSRGVSKLLNIPYWIWGLYEQGKVTIADERDIFQSSLILEKRQQGRYVNHMSVGMF